MKITAQKYAQALALMLDSAEKTIIENFLALLRQRKQSRLLPKILKSFETEWRKQRGYTKVQVSYPKKFENDLPELEAALRAKLGDKIHLATTADDELIGGYQVRVDDTLIDASIQGRLRALEHKITHS